MRCHRLAWWSPERTSGGHVRLAVHDEGPAWFWCGLVAVGQPTVLVTDHAVPPPRSSGLEVRSSGLWAEVVVEEPGLHVSVGLEAFGVAVADPEDAWRGGADHQFRGDRLAVGLDLGGEAVGEPPAGDAVPCRVVGEVLIADRVIPVDGWGWWDHQDAGGDPWSGPWTGVRARLDDGTWWAGGAISTGEPVGRAPVLVTDGGRPAVHVDRTLGPVAIDGRPGFGWVETVVPVPDELSQSPA